MSGVIFQDWRGDGAATVGAGFGAALLAGGRRGFLVCAMNYMAICVAIALTSFLRPFFTSAEPLAAVGWSGPRLRHNLRRHYQRSACGEHQIIKRPDSSIETIRRSLQRVAVA